MGKKNQCDANFRVDPHPYSNLCAFNDILQNSHSWEHKINEVWKPEVNLYASKNI